MCSLKGWPGLLTYIGNIRLREHKVQFGKSRNLKTWLSLLSGSTSSADPLGAPKQLSLNEFERPDVL